MEVRNDNNPSRRRDFSLQSNMTAFSSYNLEAILLSIFKTSLAVRIGSFGIRNLEGCDNWWDLGDRRIFVFQIQTNRLS